MLDKLINLIKFLWNISIGFLFTITIGLGLILYLPDTLAGELSIKAFRNDYRKYLGPLFLFLVLVLSYKIVHGFVRKIKDRRLRLEHLNNLTSEEKGYLEAFVIEGKNTIHVAVDDGIAGGLLEKRIIYRPNVESYNILLGIPYNLKPWAKKYLEKHKELLKGAVGKPLTQQERLNNGL